MNSETWEDRIYELLRAWRNVQYLIWFDQNKQEGVKLSKSIYLKCKVCHDGKIPNPAFEHCRGTLEEGDCKDCYYKLECYEGEVILCLNCDGNKIMIISLEDWEIIPHNHGGACESFSAKKSVPPPPFTPRFDTSEER